MMTKTTRNWIYRNARPVDFARWRYHFENGGREAVLLALAAYQNEDGGFGHALEADCWGGHSSPIQTWCATEILRETGFADGGHPIVQGMLRYLGSGKDFADGRWRNTVPENNNHPHAPWWTCNGADESYNPTASLAGFALAFAEPGGAVYRLAERTAADAVQAYLGAGSCGEMHVIACYIQLLEYSLRAGGAVPFDRDALRERIRRDVDGCLTRDTARWETDYICKPSQFDLSPDSPFYRGNEALCAYECDFIGRNLQPDGTWAIPWGWGAYPEEWAVAKSWWKANNAIRNLLFLKKMGKL